MGNVTCGLNNAIATLALKAAAIGANTTCIIGFHQPKVPKDLDKLRKV